MSNADDPRSHVQELIRQREQIRDWIARLDDAGAPDVPDRVARRVRADYEERMTRVTEELGGHRDALQGELDDLQGSVAETEKRLEEGRDALAETRLRHTIGELDDEAWEEVRPELESAAAGAEEELSRLRDEAERLARLVSEIEAAPEAGEEAAGVAEAAEPEAEEAEPVAPAEGLEPDSVPDWMRDDETTVESFPTAAAAEAGPSPAASADEVEETPAEDLPWLDALETEEAAAREEDDDAGLEFLREVDADAAPAPSPSAPEAPEAGGAALGDDDLAFLEELDRAISGEGAAEAMSPPAPAPEPEPAATSSGSDDGGAESTAEAPAQGRLLCRECGALNEPHAWYCEICGSEL